MYLSVASSVETQLREAYAYRHDHGLDNQTTIASKLGVGRSVVNKRLRGLMNMTIESISDMAWALGFAVIVHIFDPNKYSGNEFYIRSEHAEPPGLKTGTAANSLTFQPI
jgi:hypothetical protein